MTADANNTAEKEEENIKVPPWKMKKASPQYQAAYALEKAKSKAKAKAKANPKAKAKAKAATLEPKAKKKAAADDQSPTKRVAGAGSALAEPFLMPRTKRDRREMSGGSAEVPIKKV